MQATLAPEATKLGRKPAENPKSERIGFRVTKSDYSKLEDLAGELMIEPGEMARSLFMRKLEEEHEAFLARKGSQTDDTAGDGPKGKRGK